MTMRRRECIALNLKFFTHQQCCSFKKLTPILVCTILITTRCKKVIFESFRCFTTSASHNNNGNVRLNMWQRLQSPKRVCKPIIQHKSATFQSNSCSHWCPLLWTCVLCLDTTDWRLCRRCCASVQPWRRWGAAVKTILFGSASLLSL